MASTAIEKLSKDEMKSRLESSMQKAKREKAKEATRTQKGLGLLSGAAGGALAAGISNLLEDALPEGMGDEAATYGGLAVLEIVALADDGDVGMQAAFAAAGYAGWLAGQVTDSLLA